MFLIFDGKHVAFFRNAKKPTRKTEVGISTSWPEMPETQHQSRGVEAQAGGVVFFVPSNFAKKLESSNFVVLLVTINVINVHALP